MTHWYPLEPCDESFFSTAPHVYTFVQDLPASPERVWASLVAPNSVADWTPLLRSIAWTSPRPFGVGTTRTVVLPGRAMTIREYFFRWEEGRRFSFYGLEANRPLFQRFAEDYIVEEGPSGCRFTWSFALEGTSKTRLGLNALSPVNALNFRTMAHGASRYFK
ncbi:SRPBCC family protein [Jatrophihabitans sp.]|uniref:SRPBCC family protein n=1 Tax=Jatrophihabitans sp. TaxID=1932789 RepID=UPI0030C6B268|nr:Polyketide cyclase / dehydrase and lipid transport [Jatrophihabitans sp.]